MGTEQDNHLVSLTFHFVKVREQSNTLRITTTTKKPKKHNPTQNSLSFTGIIIQAKLARILRIFRECFSVNDFEVNDGVRNLPLIL